MDSIFRSWQKWEAKPQNIIVQFVMESELGNFWKWEFQAPQKPPMCLWGCTSFSHFEDFYIQASLDSNIDLKWFFEQLNTFGVQNAHGKLEFQILKSVHHCKWLTFFWYSNDGTREASVRGGNCVGQCFRVQHVFMKTKSSSSLSTII